MDRVLYVIMAGGRGDRLRPLTDNFPKPLVRFGPSGRIIDFTLYNSFHSGIGDVYVLTQYRSRMLEDYIGGTWAHAFKSLGRHLVSKPATFCEKGVYEGTADAVYQTLKERKKLPWFVVVLAGDHVYRMDYRAMIRRHQKHGSPATVAAVVCERDEAHRFGIIEASQEGRVFAFHEKPETLSGIVPPREKPLASMGIYVFTTRELMRTLEKNQDDQSKDFGRDILPAMTRRGEVYIHRFMTGDGRNGYWRDVGDLHSYWSTHLELLKGKCGELFFEPAPGLGDPPFSLADLVEMRIRDGATLVNSMVSKRATIRGALVEESVVCPDVHIEEGAVVKKSVLLDGCVVRAGAEVVGSIVEPLAEISRKPDSLDPAHAGIHRVASFSKPVRQRPLPHRESAKKYLLQ